MHIFVLSDVSWHLLVNVRLARVRLGSRQRVNVRLA